MFRVFAFVGAAALAALSVAAAPAATPSAPIHITIGAGGKGLYHFYPLYVAQAEHFFEKEGLDVTWLQVAGGSQLVASLVGGSAQVAPMALEHVVIPGERAAGLVEFAKLFDVDPYSLVLSNKAIADSGIKPDMPLAEKLRRLNGMTIGITAPGGASDTFVRFMMKSRGINADQLVRLQPMGSVAAMLGALSRNMIQGLSMSTPVDTVAVSKGYGKVVISAFNAEVPELRGMPFTGMVATQSYIAAHPEVIARVTRAISDALRFNVEHPAETRDALFQYSLIADRPVYDGMIRQYQNAAARSPVLTEPQFANLVKWVQLGEQEPVKTRFSDAVDNRFADKTAAESLGRK